MKKVALITGVTGQDGSYLAELLLEKGYEVHGLLRRSSSFNRERIEHLYHYEVENRKFFLHYGDLTDSSNIIRLLQDIKPQEIYNLAAQSHVQVSFEVPEYTANADAMGTLRLLEAVRILKMEKTTRIYQASTSELYGKVQEVPQKETTPFYPRSPYGVAKLYGYWITKNYRESYDMYACNGILFNHESPRRGENFVTRKITLSAAKIYKGKQHCLYLGNINALRDWGYAKDFVEAMWLMLQQEKPEDFVIATGEMHTVKEFVDETFKCMGVGLEWKGENENTTATVTSLENSDSSLKVGDVVVKVDKKYYRPAEVDQLLGDPTKAKDKLGWKPNVKFKELVKIMIEADLKKVSN